MTNRVEKYDIWLNVQSEDWDGLDKPIASVALREERGALEEFALRYRPEYLAVPSAIPLDPVALPLQKADIFLACRSGGLPGLLDDYLPDDWGRRVLAQLAFYTGGTRVQQNSPIDLLAMMGGNRIGAVQWVKAGESPKYELGAPISRLGDAEVAARNVDESGRSVSLDEHSLIYLANCGTGVGGARPKALIEDNGKAYLAKFNRATRDDYNNARVELACLNMASAAGLRVGSGRVVDGVAGREVLLLERFDVQGHHRWHLVTVNTLLKLQENQCDRGGAFRYDDIAKLIQKYSLEPEKDLEQLFLQMLFNAAINNTDDHERNFSFMGNKDGFVLSPAYDMVPTLAVGQYHVAGYQYSPSPPLPSQLSSGKVFGLPKTTVSRLVDQVVQAVGQFEKFAREAGLSEEDFDAVSQFIKA